MGPYHSFRSQLAPIASTLLQQKEDFATLTPSISGLFKLLTEIAGLNEYSPSERTPVLTASGKAIGTYWASMCIQDMLRTRRFVRGLFEAITAARIQFPDRPVHVLYAGSGPFGTLSLPVMCDMQPSEVQFTFLEINPISAEMLQKTLHALGFEAFVREIIQTDASQYLPASEVHILLTETMQHTLIKEPQVAITQHLVPFLHPKGFLVPEQIVIRAGLLRPAMAMTRLMDFTHTPEHYIRYLKDVFILNKETASAFSSSFPVVSVVIDPLDRLKFPELNLFTLIHIFDNIMLSPWESGLTLPKRICHLDPQPSPNESHTFQYQLSHLPGFIHQVNPVS